MKIVSISGLDGSGKSTQIEALKKHLESKGLRVFHLHAIQFSLAKKIQKFRQQHCIFGKCKKSSTDQEKSVTSANWIQIQLRKIFLLIDVLRFRIFAKKPFFDYIVSDRYFFDSAININYLSKKNATLWIESLIPRPDLMIYLNTDPENIMERKRVPDQGIDYLKEKKRLYDIYAKRLGMVTVNGNRNQELILGDIKENINKL